MKEVVFFISPAIGYIMLFSFVRQIVPSNMKYHKMVLWLIPVILVQIPKYYLGTLALVARIVGVLTAAGTMIFYPLLFFPQHKWKGLLYGLVFHALQVLSEGLCIGIYWERFGGVGLEEYTAMQLSIYVVTLWTIYFMIGAICVLFARTLSLKRFQPIYLLFLIFPLSQTVLVGESVFGYHNWLWIVGAVMGLVAEVVLLFSFIGIEKKAELEKEVSELRYTMEREQAYYQTVEARQEELSRIRHDFNNQLAVIGQLIRSGEEEDARRMIDHLSSDIRAAGVKRHCAIPVVNAVLTEKEQEAAKSGVTLALEVSLPEDTAVEPLHLCSVFSNLLDNAIRAAADSGAENAAVQLRTKVDGDYLFIKTENPCPQEKKAPAQGHGYGTKILQSLAEQYGGDYRAEEKDGCYTAVVSLLGRNA